MCLCVITWEPLKVCQGQLCGIYNDSNTCYISNAFKDFKDVLDYKHGTVSLRWIIYELDLNILRVEYLAFQCARHTFYAIYLNHFTRRPRHVIWNIYNNIMEEVKQFYACMSLFYNHSKLFLWNSCVEFFCKC